MPQSDVTASVVSSQIKIPVLQEGTTSQIWPNFTSNQKANILAAWNQWKLTWHKMKVPQIMILNNAWHTEKLLQPPDFLKAVALTICIPNCMPRRGAPPMTRACISTARMVYNSSKKVYFFDDTNSHAYYSYKSCSKSSYVIVLQLWRHSAFSNTN